jgi:hypothetical protein
MALLRVLRTGFLFGMIPSLGGKLGDGISLFLGGRFVRIYKGLKVSEKKVNECLENVGNSVANCRFLEFR